MEQISKWATCLVEVGGGSGYVADALRGLGVTVNSFDNKDLDDDDGTFWHSWQKLPWFAGVKKGNVEDAFALVNNECNTLMLIWPTPELCDKLGVDKLGKLKQVIYVGEPAYSDGPGINGKANFFKALESSGLSLCHASDIDNFPCMDGRLFLFKRGVPTSEALSVPYLDPGELSSRLAALKALAVKYHMEEQHYSYVLRQIQDDPVFEKEKLLCEAAETVLTTENPFECCSTRILHLNHPSLPQECIKCKISLGYGSNFTITRRWDWTDCKFRNVVRCYRCRIQCDSHPHTWSCFAAVGSGICGTALDPQFKCLVHK